jgi:hypothetical protein
MRLGDDPLCLYFRDRLAAHTPRRILAVAIKAEMNSTSRFVDNIDCSISSAQSPSSWLYEKACVGRWSVVDQCVGVFVKRVERVERDTERAALAAGSTTSDTKGQRDWPGVVSQAYPVGSRRTRSGG